MKCPSCSGKLAQMSAGGVSVDVCSAGCGGMWFDRKEIEHFDEQHEFDLEKVLTKKGSTAANASKVRKCPRCTVEVMARMSFDNKNQVEIDQCWMCAGVWLDGGELSTIRSQFKTAADRQKAGDDYVNKAGEAFSAALQRERLSRKIEESHLEEKMNVFQRAILMLVRGLRNNPLE